MKEFLKQDISIQLTHEQADQFREFLVAALEGCDRFAHVPPVHVSQTVRNLLVVATVGDQHQNVHYGTGMTFCNLRPTTKSLREIEKEIEDKAVK